MKMSTHEFATRPALIRQALDLHTIWIEKTLGLPIYEAVIVQCDISLINAAIPRLLNINLDDAQDKSVHRFVDLLESVEIPPSCAPMLQADANKGTFNFDELLSGVESRHPYSLGWDDCPIAFIVRGFISPLIAMAVSYHAGPGSDRENTAQILVIRREAAEQVLHLLEELSKSDGEPKLHTHNGIAQNIRRCEWDQLVLDPNVVSLLKNDFESFFQREPWFRRMRLPFRRGYLLHGPPGNGKSTAVRAMLTSGRLTAYTIRFFDSQIDDGDLERVFARAVKHAPAMILLEDIDRAFPRTGESRCKVSLQQLLNCLDGVATGEGIITVATANEPTILDPAILRRPGRFDRVVHFADPSPMLRREYFIRMQKQFTVATLDAVVADSSGFSFAQLREAYIIAGQMAFEENREICVEDLSSGVLSLRRTSQLSSKRNNRAGFTSSLQMECAQ